ncbi:MAG TPA: hypothetical protein VM513_23180 [Kofleriaceae bacterium]|nr:hypothetical protein [Kofleriaceae bacterium]
MKQLLSAVVVAICLSACGGSLKVEPVQVKPIHVTVDVNLKGNDAPATTPAPK